MRLLLIVFITLVTLNTRANAPGEYFDLTRTDIVSEGIQEKDNISVYGIHLGIGLDDCQTIVSELEGKNLIQDRFNNTRYYLVEESDETVLAYFIWNERKGGLSEMVVYQTFAKYMVGESRKLFSEEVIQSPTALTKSFLGLKKSEKEVLNIPSVELKHTLYGYDATDLQIMKQVNKSRVTYAICFKS